MIVHVTGHRAKDFLDAPYGIAEGIKYKKKIAEDIRKKLELKGTDTVLVDIVG